MKKAISLCFSLFLIFVMSACVQNEFEEILFRTTDDPFYDTPYADSLSLEHTIYLAWKEDAAADKYRLMRSYDNLTRDLKFDCIYEGDFTSYTDRDLTENGRYVYRLDKVRGKKVFEGNTFSYGWSSSCRRDFDESNDTEQNATELEPFILHQCTLTCAKFLAEDKRVLDTDWFCIKVDHYSTKQIVINQSNITEVEKNESADTGDGAPTYISYMIAGIGESRPVKQNEEIYITNPDKEDIIVYLKVFPNEQMLFGNNDVGAVTVIEYTIQHNRSDANSKK